MTSHMIRLTAVAVLSLWSVPGAAKAPETSLRPVLRAPAPAGAVSGQALERRRPVARPPSEQVMLAAVGLPVTSPGRSLRPYLRPDSVTQQAFLFKRKKRRGSVCGNIDIQGEEIGRVPGKLKGCGIAEAVRVTSVSGIRLSQPSVMTCEAAEALNAWAGKGVRPAFKPLGKVDEMRVASHYACRTRNNQRGARISEHGKGKAIDISAFVLDTGREITVLEGWRGGQERKALLRAWQAACGPFRTVLGPNSDRYHRDHFHIDVARYGGRAYCR